MRAPYLRGKEVGKYKRRREQGKITIQMIEKKNTRNHTTIYLKQTNKSYKNLYSSKAVYNYTYIVFMNFSYLG